MILNADFIQKETYFAAEARKDNNKGFQLVHLGKLPLTTALFSTFSYCIKYILYNLIFSLNQVFVVNDNFIYRDFPFALKSVNRFVALGPTAG
jgi:hypothetical protein